MLLCKEDVAGLPVFSTTLTWCIAGVVLNVVFLSWLYAYYCFDYKWALEGIRLPNRLHFFECNWAYFAGEQF
jgi:hypothetical protein